MSGGRVPSRFYTELPNLAIGNWNFTDDAGATGAFTIFTVTGDVLVGPQFGICDVALTSGGTPTLELGVAGQTAILIAQIANATDLILDEIWQDATPTATAEALAAPDNDFIIAAGQDIIMTLAAAALTAGDIDFYCFWRPLSPDGSVAAP